MWVYVLLGAVLALPLLFLLRRDYVKKRGCGRGCATCGNRHLCHPGQYDPPGEKKPKP